MSGYSEAAGAARRGRSTPIERRVRLLAVLGILLTSCVIGGIATVLLYNSQVSTLTSQLSFAIRLQTPSECARHFRQTPHRKSIRQSPRTSPSPKPVASSAGYKLRMIRRLSGRMSSPGLPWHWRHS